MFNIFKKPFLVKVEVSFLDQNRFSFSIDEKKINESEPTHIIERFTNKIRIVLYTYIKILIRWQKEPQYLVDLSEFTNKLANQLLNKDIGLVLDNYDLICDQSASSGKRYVATLSDYAINMKDINVEFPSGDEHYYSEVFLIALILSVAKDNKQIAKALGRGLQKINNKIIKDPFQSLSLLAETVSKEVIYK